MSEHGEPPITDEERFAQHVARLRALHESGILGESSADQVRRVLTDVADALGIDYAEISGCREMESRDLAPICVIGLEAAPLRALGARFADHEPQFIADTARDDLRSHVTVMRLGLRSVLLWPFDVDARRYVLALAWKSRRRDMDRSEREYFAFLVELLTRLLRAREREFEMTARASCDSLTGLPNRSAILEHLARTLHAAEREKAHAALLYIDLNDFKRINDEYGHLVGDRTLAQIASRLQSVLRRHEVCGRIGGDEFCVIISSFGAEGDLQAIVQRLLHTFDAPIAIDVANTVHSSASIGIAIYPQHGENPQELLAHADRAMYEAKPDRRGAFTFASTERSQETHQPTIRIDAGSLPGDFVLCYQPIVAARTGRLIAVEVLPRWLHAGTMSPPDVFLQAARSQHVLERLDSAMLEHAQKRSEKLTLPPRVTLHVNVAEPSTELPQSSPAQRAVALELTAEQVARQPERYGEFIGDCKERGFSVGLAHFGNGDLPLRALLTLRVDFVKIGRAEWFTKLVDYAHELRCSVIAEGVETEAERRLLTATNVDALQGFAIASPLVEHDFRTWMQRYREGSKTNLAINSR